MSNNRSYDLTMLCQQLAPGDMTLVDEVDLAVRNPQRYVVTFNRRLARRGIYPGDDTEHPQLPWIALLDGLAQRGHLAEIDWKEGVSDTMRSIDRLLADRAEEPEVWDWVNDDAWEDAPTIAFLHAVAGHFIKRGLLLAYLAYPSDSYPLILLDPQQLRGLHVLAQQAGYGAVVSLLEATDSM